MKKAMALLEKESKSKADSGP